MVDKVFPCTDDNLDEVSLREWVAGISASNPYVESGFVVSDSTGLFIDISAGVAYAGGVRMSRDVATLDIALTASATNHVWVTFDDAVQDGVLFVVNTTGTAPSTPNAKLAEVVTGASSITTITDKRDLGPPAGGFIARKNSTGSDFKRRRANLIEGIGILITVSDDAANNEVDVTVTWYGLGFRKNSVAISNRRNIHFIDGAGVNVALTDDSANDEMEVVLSWTGVAVKKAGTTTGTRRAINFIEGGGITITTADDSGGDKVDVTLTVNPMNDVVGAMRNG